MRDSWTDTGRHDHDDKNKDESEQHIPALNEC